MESHGNVPIKIDDLIGYPKGGLLASIVDNEDNKLNSYFAPALITWAPHKLLREHNITIECCP